MATVIKAGNVASGAQVTSDATGILQFNTGSGAGTTAMTIGTDQSVTFAGAISSSGNQTVTGNLTVNGNTTLGDANTDTILMTGAPSIGGAGLGMGFGFRNRIINGNMVIDQRNAGASVTINSGSFTFVTDRFAGFGQATDGVFTLQRSTVAPTNFTNSLLATVTTADASIGGTQLYGLMHRIEGFNTADFNWGSANAVAITLSFWVRSSVTGTFGGALLNNGQTRSYAFTYTISAANTWEQKTVTIAGDTSGTWATNNSVGVEIQWSLGCGASLLAAAGAWNNAAFYGATGQTNLIATNGATFYITGVQLEKGSTATSFDYRPYGTELQLCQRYFETSFNAGTAPANNIDDGFQTIASGGAGSTAHVPFAVAKRASPTMTFYSANIMTSPTPTNGQWQFYNGTSWGNGSATQTNRARMYGFSAYLSMSVAGGYAAAVNGNWVASSEL